MTSVATAERDALCDLFLAVGPDAPTLAGDWTTRDLAAHLVVRERRPDGAAGIIIRPLADYAEKVRRAEAARPWDELVALVRRGPPAWNPMRLGPVDRFANSVEFFVHHEDVRRARPDWTPRQLDPALEDAMATVIARGGRMLTRKARPRDHPVPRRSRAHPAPGRDARGDDHRAARGVRALRLRTQVGRPGRARRAAGCRRRGPGRAVRPLTPTIWAGIFATGETIPAQIGRLTRFPPRWRSGAGGRLPR